MNRVFRFASIVTAAMTLSAPLQSAKAAGTPPPTKDTVVLQRVPVAGTN